MQEKLTMQEFFKLFTCRKRREFLLATSFLGKKKSFFFTSAQAFFLRALSAQELGIGHFFYNPDEKKAAGVV